MQVLRILSSLGKYIRKNEPSLIGRIYSNKNTASFINAVCQLLIIDIIFISFNIYINKYVSSSLQYIFILVINISLTYASLILLRRLGICSSEFASNLGEKLNVNIQYINPNNKLLNFEVQCLDSLYLIQNGIVSCIQLLFYPIRFGIFGYIFFNGSWNTFLFVNKAIELLIFIAIFEFLKIKALLIPRQKSIILKISNYLDNLKALLLLSNHREAFINSAKSTINFTKELLNFIIIVLQSICTLYFIYRILSFFNENSIKLELLQIYIIDYWLAIYLICSESYIYSSLLFLINYGSINTLYQNSNYILLNYRFQSQNLSCSNIIDNEESTSNPILEPLIDYKDFGNVFQISNNCGINLEEYLVMNKTNCSVRKCYKDHSTSEKISDVISVAQNEYIFDNKDNFAVAYNNDKLDYQDPNRVSFNPTIISFKNLSLSVFDEDKFKKQIQSSSNRFKYFNLFKGKNGQNNYSNDYHDHCLGEVANNELVEHKFYLNNINLSIKMNELIIIFGSNERGKELLTKFISGFPGIMSNEQFEYYQTKLFNYEVHLINKNMLDFVSNFFEYQESEFKVDPFDFILSGQSFNKQIFDLIFNSFLCDYFTSNEPSVEDSEAIKSYIYPKVESIQQFVEAKIFLQLSQFFYHILVSLDSYSSAVIIIDGIFELLLPSTCIKLIEKILPNNSVFSNFNISFIVTTNNDLFKYLSYLYNNNSYVKLGKMDRNGLTFINDNYLNKELNEKLVENFPSVDNTINEIFNTGLSNDNIYPCSKDISSISKLYFKKFEAKNFYSKKILFFIFFIGLFSFITKFILFSNKYLNESYKNINSFYDFFVFEIVTFYPYYSSFGTSTFLYSNGLSSMLIGYAAISSFLLNGNTFLSEADSFKTLQDTYIQRDNISEEILKFSRMLPEKNHESSYFIKQTGKQILKSTSSFYSDHFPNNKVIYIPSTKSIGFNNALISSKLIQNKLTHNSKKGSNSKVLQKSEQITLGQIEKLKLNINMILIVVIFFIINMISKFFINITIFGFSTNNINSVCNNCFHEFSRIVLYSDDPISVISDIELRKNSYFLYLFKDIYYRRSKVVLYYFTLIHFLSLLFFFGISSNFHSSKGAGALMNKNLLIIIILFPILYKSIKFFKLKKKNFKFTSVICNSLDYYHYLNESNSLTWFRNQTSKLFTTRLKRSKEFFCIKLNLLLNSYILSMMATFLYFLFNFKKNGNNNQFAVDLIIFLSIIFLLIQSLQYHINEGSIASTFTNLNFYSYLKRLKISIKKACYFPIYINISTNLTSPKTNSIISPNSRDSAQHEDGFELSTPNSGTSLKMDLNLSTNSIQIQLNSGIMLSLINPLLFLESSIKFGSGRSPLFPVKLLKTVSFSNLDKIAMVSNYNIISSFWSVKMALDPKGIYINDDKLLLDTLELLKIFPVALNFDPERILSFTIQEYIDLINSQPSESASFVNIKMANGIESEFGISGSIKLNKQFSVKSEFLPLDEIYIKKLILFGHFTLYSMYYRELILDLDYSMDLEVWISIVKQFFENKKSSINNIIIISPDVSLFNIDKT